MRDVLVLGGSVSAGGGVGNNPSRAWHSPCSATTRSLALRLKSAIDPSYFLHCTARFADHDHYDAALFDLGANMFDPSCEREPGGPHRARALPVQRALGGRPQTGPGLSATNSHAPRPRGARAPR